jgi:ribosomal protein L37AE/L43A
MLTGRAVAHIRNKVLKRFRPSAANSNAPATIVRVHAHIWLCASRDHRFPGGILWPDYTASRIAMFEFSRTKILALKTSTTLALS